MLFKDGKRRTLLVEEREALRTERILVGRGSFKTTRKNCARLDIRLTQEA